MRSFALETIGRALLGLAFIGPGLVHFWFSSHKGQFRPIGLALLETSAGLALALNLRARWFVLAFVVFLVADAFAAHAFWAKPAAEQSDQALHFFKNLAIVGGMLLLLRGE
ncbi:MAG: hypothetical protein JO218_06830 [Burkholderiales bacterium]|nr:hypothetical protein [Burkholderiales bacterium]